MNVQDITIRHTVGERNVAVHLLLKLLKPWAYCAN